MGYSAPSREESDTTERLCTAQGIPGGSDGKESACNAGDPWVAKIPRKPSMNPQALTLSGFSHYRLGYFTEVGEKGRCTS